MPLVEPLGWVMFSCLRCPVCNAHIWLDSNAMNKYQLTPLDIINQLKTQNDQIAAGQLGGTPSVPGQQLNASIIAQTRANHRKGFVRDAEE